MAGHWGTVSRKTVNWRNCADHHKAHSLDTTTDPAANTQAEFDYFYTVTRNLMDEFYPEQTITLTI